MKIEELKAMLRDFPDDWDVFLSINRVSPKLLDDGMIQTAYKRIVLVNEMEEAKLEGETK